MMASLKLSGAGTDGFPIEKAMEIIKEESGTHFDPKIVDVFLESREELEKIISKYAE